MLYERNIPIFQKIIKQLFPHKNEEKGDEILIRKFHPLLQMSSGSAVVEFLSHVGARAVIEVNTVNFEIGALIKLFQLFFCFPLFVHHE